MKAMNIIAAAVLGVTAGACSSFLHFSDPSAQAVTCLVTESVLTLLQELAQTIGIPLHVVEQLYSEGCTQAAKEGLTPDQAMRFGLEHAHARAYRMAFERKAAP